MNLCIFCHKLLLGFNLITTSSQGIKSAPTRGHEADLGAPVPTGLLGTGQRLQSEQGGRSCRSWDGTATADVSRVCGVFWVPQRPSTGSQVQGGSAGASVLRTGQAAPGVGSVPSSSHRPLQRWDGGAASIVGSQREKSAQAVFSGDGGEAPTPVPLLPVPGFACRRKRARMALPSQH